MDSNNRNKNRIFSLLLKILAAIAMLLLIICFVKTCQNCKQQQIRTLVIQRTGYLPENEPWDLIPKENPPYRDEYLDSLPDSVSLEHLFPPIGDQGVKGTCVAWAVGYNLVTALFAQDNKWTIDELSDPQNQISPADLWLGIPAGKKQKPCGFTDFWSAFDVLISKGAASMKRVPYSNMGSTCKGGFIGDTNNRIAGFNRIVSDGELPSVKQLKGYLADTIPLAFSAMVGFVFSSWSGDGVFNSPDNGMTSGHAMVISGYDDSKHAFRIRNSWGTAWGDEGSAWVDYDFFINSFCKEVFKANN
ncbi:MAG: C1 family peptidase [Bacteroidales bacterium]|nr:C1 family peptidase [Bacteroidales bacterium]